MSSHAVSDVATAKSSAAEFYVFISFLCHAVKAIKLLRFVSYQVTPKRVYI